MGRESSLGPTLARSHFLNYGYPTLPNASLQPVLENSGPWVLLEAKKLAGSLRETWRRVNGMPENLSSEARGSEGGHEGWSFLTEQKEGWQGYRVQIQTWSRSWSWIHPALPPPSPTPLLIPGFALG